MKKFKLIPAFAGMTLLLLSALPAFAQEAAKPATDPAPAEAAATKPAPAAPAAESAAAVPATPAAAGSITPPEPGPYLYAPEGCEFRLNLPEAPFETRKCQPDNPDDCKDITGFTKVFGMEATVSVNVTCTDVDPKLYNSYTGDIMQATLSAAATTNHLDEYQTGFQESAVAKQAALLGVGKTGNSEKIFVSQLWVGHKSVFSVEAELVGQQTEEADSMFASILRSIRHESWKPGEPAPAAAATAAPAPEAATAPAPAPDAPKKASGKKGSTARNAPTPGKDAAPQDKKVVTKP